VIGRRGSYYTRKRWAVIRAFSVLMVSKYHTPGHWVAIPSLYSGCARACLPQDPSGAPHGCRVCADNRSRALCSGRENEAPSEAGPQQRVDSKGRGSPAGGSLRNHIRTSNAGVAQSERRKDVVRSYFSKYRCTTGMDAEKFEASSKKQMVKRHLWHPSDRAMITRLFHLAHSIEHSRESARDIAWWA